MIKRRKGAEMIEFMMTTPVFIFLLFYGIATLINFQSTQTNIEYAKKEIREIVVQNNATKIIKSFEDDFGMYDQVIVTVVDPKNPEIPLTSIEIKKGELTFGSSSELATYWKMENIIDVNIQSSIVKNWSALRYFTNINLNGESYNIMNTNMMFNFKCNIENE